MPIYIFVSKTLLHIVNLLINLERHFLKQAYVITYKLHLIATAVFHSFFFFPTWNKNNESKLCFMPTSYMNLPLAFHFNFRPYLFIDMSYLLFIRLHKLADILHGSVFFFFFFFFLFVMYMPVLSFLSLFDRRPPRNRLWPGPLAPLALYKEQWRGPLAPLALYKEQWRGRHSTWLFWYF